MKFWQSRHNPQCKLSQQDLLDISKEIIQTYAPHEPHYQPELVLMPVDPINLYAYWKLKDNKTDDANKHVDKQLLLKIYSIPEISEHSNTLQFSFEIKVDGFRNQQKVHLPVAATAYSAVIGEINADNSFSTLATANTIHVPRENPVSDNNANKRKKILQINKINKNNSTPEVSTQNTDFETFIVKNFNDYGYDLTVYHHKSVQEFKNFLAKQGINTQLSSSKKTNTSSQGRFL
ncbi:MAG: DUF4912 domain-containing protein [Methyloprofundus sp.]|nr:DUF4912 domain-containing protein [Methyloprofundus sp.]